MAPASAQLLYPEFLTPQFYGFPSTEYSAWGVLYTPQGFPNFPDLTAPYSFLRTASAAGVTPPPNANPANPMAFWDSRNPTLSQSVAGAIIRLPGTGGDIVNFSGATAFSIQDATDYALGTVLLQFETEGTAIDLNTLRLECDPGTGVVSLPPVAFVREHRDASTGALGGLRTRLAAQWNIDELGVDTYVLKFGAAAPMSSLQVTAIDTSQSLETVVPPGRTWIAGGSAFWSASANWQEGTPAIVNGNATFTPAANATITLTTQHTAGELIFATAPAVQIVASGGATFKFHTGVTKAAASTGLTELNLSVTFGGHQLFDVKAGELRLSQGSDGSFGLTKSGAGTLTLSGSHAFQGVVLVEAGLLQLTSGTTVQGGDRHLIAAGATLDLGGGTLGTESSVTTVAAGGLLTGRGTLHGSLVVHGTMVLNGATTITGPITNNGLIVIPAGASLTAANATFVNNGTLDLLTGSFTPPAGFVNNGTILTAASLKCGIARPAGTVEVTVDSRTYHRYRLQRSTGLGSASFVAMGPEQVGSTGSVLTFVDASPPIGEAFYRIVVDP